MPKEASAMGDGNPLPEVLLRRRCWCLKIAGYEGSPPWPYHAGSQKSGDGFFFFLALKEGINGRKESLEVACCKRERLGNNAQRKRGANAGFVGSHR